MNVWLLQIGEPIIGIDVGARSGRCNMLVRALLSRGHQVTWWSSTFHHFKKAYRAHAHLSKELQPGFTVKLVHAVPAYQRNSSPLRLLNQRALARHFRALSAGSPPPDVILACLPTPEFCREAVRYGRRTGVPVILDVRDPWPDLYLNIVPKPFRPLARLLLFREFQRSAQCFRQATTITAVSSSYLQWGLDRAGRAGTPQDRVFPIGYTAAEICSPVADAEADAFAAQHRIDRRRMIVTFAGVFGSSYDLETVVACAQLCHASGRSDVLFVLAGGGDKAESLRRQARGLDNLIFTGWLDQPSLRTLLQISAVGLCAYTAQATQTLPNKPFEYMAAGLPQVSSLPGELAELLQKHRIGRSYSPGDAHSLYENIVALADDPPLRREMADRAREVFAREFDADRIYPVFADHLERVARVPHRPSKTAPR